MKMIDSIKRWFRVKKDVAAIKINKSTESTIDDNLIDLVKDELEIGNESFNQNCHRAAKFNVSINDFSNDLEKLKSKFKSFEEIYKSNLMELKNDPTNESLRSRLTQMMITKNQMENEISMKEDAYKNLLKEKEKLEKCIRKQKMMIAENKAKSNLLIAKKGIIDMYKKMNINSAILEPSSNTYLNRLDNEIKINDELKNLSERINPEEFIDDDIEVREINKMLEAELAKLN